MPGQYAQCKLNQGNGVIANVETLSQYNNCEWNLSVIVFHLTVGHFKSGVGVSVGVSVDDL